MADVEILRLFSCGVQPRGMATHYRAIVGLKWSILQFHSNLPALISYPSFSPSFPSVGRSTLSQPSKPSLTCFFFPVLDTENGVGCPCISQKRRCGGVGEGGAGAHDGGLEFLGSFFDLLLQYSW